MLGNPVQSRASARVNVGRTAWLTLHTHDAREHLAFVKDISSKGILVYSDFRPSVGDRLDFTVEYLSGLNRTRLHLSGKVVRVEQGAPGSAVAVAVSFDSTHIGTPLSSGQASKR